MTIEITEPNEADKMSGELIALNALAHNPAWLKVMEKLGIALEDAKAGMADRLRSPEQRSEWVEAYHLANDLLDYVPAKQKELTTALRAWQAKQSTIAQRTLA